MGEGMRGRIAVVLMAVGVVSVTAGAGVAYGLVGGLVAFGAAAVVLSLLLGWR